MYEFKLVTMMLDVFMITIILWFVGGLNWKNHKASIVGFLFMQILYLMNMFCMWRQEMVKIEFLGGTEEIIEPEEGYQAFHYLDVENAYVVRGIEGEVHYPREFVKSIRHIKK